MVSEEYLYQQLDDNDVQYSVTEHEAVFTVLESKKLSHQILGADTKNLFLEDKQGQFYLVTVLADKRVDLRLLSNILSCGRFNFGDADAMQPLLNISPGSVTPMAIINDDSQKVIMVLDEILAASPRMNVHPLRNTATISLSGLDMVRMLTKWGHAPIILNIPTKS